MGNAQAGPDAGRVVERVVVGMDPHKRSVTIEVRIEVMVGDETILGGGRFATTAEGYRAMRAHVAMWPERVWAIEGCAGIGGHVATRLLGDGEQVLDVPAKLSARARVFATGQGRARTHTGRSRGSRRRTRLCAMSVSIQAMPTGAPHSVESVDR